MSARQTGTGGSTSKVVHSYGWQVGANRWLRPSFLSTWASLWGCFLSWELASHGKNDPTDAGRSCSACCDLSADSHFWHILFVVQSQPWFIVGGDYARPWITSDHPRGWSPQPPFYWWLFNLFPRNIIIPSISVPCLKYFPVVSEVELPNYFSKWLLYLFNFQISLWEYTFPSPSPILSVCNYFNLC